MRIIIDMQGAQTAGRVNAVLAATHYSLTQAIVRQRGMHDIVLVLNAAYADAVDWMRDDFPDCCPE